ncbi:MAG TPA: hypothetical protein VFK90_13170 [Anaeromyxobacter sp.]|nr:hypothetical protein [Anaeromyxobacter sp.]
MTQSERLIRREELRADIVKLETDLAALREQEARLLEGCEHAYADGRAASTGGRIRICSICGSVLKQRDDKLWG